MPNTNERDALIAAIIRDACECERPVKYDVDTVELRVADLRLIVERNLAATAPNAAAPTAEDAARWVEKRMNDFIHEHGHTDPDTGALEFGRGAHAEEKEEYVGELEEIIAGIRSLMPCDAAPAGWSCSRARGHSGPCAAAPAQQAGAPLPLAPSEAVTAEIHESEEGHIRATLRAPKIAEYDLTATREEGKSWYIHVTDGGGFSVYNGYWRDSERKSRAEVLVEAAHGSRLGVLATRAQPQADAAALNIDTRYADAEVRDAGGKLLAVVHAGEQQSRLLSALRAAQAPGARGEPK